MGAGLHQMAGGAQPPASSSSSSSSSFPSSLTVLDQRPNSHTHSRGIRFLNTDWNDSISNGDSFGLKWNVSVAGTAAKLGLFKVTYPENGVVVYEFASNLTDYMESTSCDWKPEGLDDELYALWLAATDEVASNWTISPPWKPIRRSKDDGHSKRWLLPFVIPVCSLLALYAICLTAYLSFRKRRDAREARQAAFNDIISRSNNRVGAPPSHASVAAGSGDTANTTRTVETFTFELIKGNDGLSKPGPAWLCTNTTAESSEPSPEAVVSQDSRKGSKASSAHEGALVDPRVRLVRYSPDD